MRDLLRPETELAFPVFQGGLLTTAPPRKSLFRFHLKEKYRFYDGKQTTTRLRENNCLSECGAGMMVSY